MFGTVARMKVKAGREQDLMALSDEIDSDLAGGNDTGAIAEYVFKLDNAPNEYIMVAIFKDRESYVANAQRPETDRNYRKMREMLDADPEWNDGEIIHSATHASVGI